MKLTLVAVLAMCALGCTPEHETTSNAGPDRTSLPAGTANNTTVNAAGGVNSRFDAPTESVDDFWTKAAEGGMAEVEMGKLASTNAESAEVRQFGEMMVADHSKANIELMGLAAKNGVRVPYMPDHAHQAKAKELSGMRGAAFDRAYMDAMVADHEKTVELFRTQASNQNGPKELTEWASQTLPTLEKHLEMARTIRSKLP
jgi:putative membrane protein